MNETSGITVTQLNLMIADAIRKDPRIRSVSVHGEVSGFRHHLASGHWYFSLKDENSAISCVMFRQNTFRARIRPKDGDSVLLTGYVDAYPKNGTYQLYVMSLQQDGIGELYVRFEELKNRLNAEGLFDPARKRMLPMVPRKVAVVTSGSGAAWHDILNVSAMRNPSVPIVLIPVTVQGEKAAAEIVHGIRAVNDMTDADVLIIARGGGSAEDLWCFNEEAVARAVAASRIPVVSGVGHEIDTTICDLAADVRASTPSNAAEIVFPDRRELHERSEKIRTGLQRAAETEVANAKAKVRQAIIDLVSSSPERHVSNLISGTTLCRERLEHSIRFRLECIAGQMMITRKDLSAAVTRFAEAAGKQLIRYRERLDAISPLRVLDRGFAIVSSRDGKTLTRTGPAMEAKIVNIRFADGTVEAAVKKNGVQKSG